MGYVCVLILVITNTALCYHFYNPATHQLLVRPSLDDIPKGYKLVPPPRSHTRRRSRLTRGGNGGYCSDGGFTCNTPYDKSQTFQFECTSDDQCPLKFKCCPQKCFLHKICIKATYSSNSSKISDRNKKSCNYERPGQCSKWSYNCPVPYHYSTTYRFKCNQDSQCPRNFKCCQQNCFMHKICSQIISSITKAPEKIISADETEIEQTTEITTESNQYDLIEPRLEQTTEITTESSQYDLIEPRLDLSTTVTEEETTESTTPTTEATTVTEEVTEELYTSEDSETTTENDREVIPIQTNPETEKVTEVVKEETEVSTEAEFKTTVINIGLRKVTVASKRSTLDANAIDPNYVEFYQDNSTEYDTYEDKEDEDYEYNYDDETASTEKPL